MLLFISLLVSIIAITNNVFWLFLWDKLSEWGFFCLPVHTKNAIQVLSVGCLWSGPSPPATLPLTLFQHAEHTLTSGPLHWQLPLFGGLLPRMAYSLTSPQMSPQHRGLPWSPWDSMDPHHHSLAFVLLYLLFSSLSSCIMYLSTARSLLLESWRNKRCWFLNAVSQCLQQHSSQVLHLPVQWGTWMVRGD